MAARADDPGLDHRTGAELALHRPAPAQQGPPDRAGTWRSGRPSTATGWRPRSPGGRPGPRCWCSSTCPASPRRAAARPRRPPALVARAVDLGLDVRGLMGVAPAGSPEDARPGFRRLVALADGSACAMRSIGMSADLEVAVRGGVDHGPHRPRPVRRGGRDRCRRRDVNPVISPRVTLRRQRSHVRIVSGAPAFAVA